MRSSWAILRVAPKNRQIRIVRPGSPHPSWECLAMKHFVQLHVASFLALATLLGMTRVHGQDYLLEPLSEAAPDSGVSEEIAKTLAPGGVRVMRGSNVYCELWLCKQWSLEAVGAKVESVNYPFEPGQLVGVVRFRRKSADFRKQAINKGVYTLRYARQPVDGNHVGTSPTRDFLLVLEAAKDKSPAKLDYKALTKASADSIGTAHPGLLSLAKPAPEGDVALRHDEGHDWWIARLKGKSKTGDKESDLAIDLVVIGHAAE